MIEYSMTLEHEIRIQPFVTFLLYKAKTVSSIVLALLSIVFFILTATVNTGFVFLGVALALASIHMLLFWIRKTRVRSMKMANLYRSQETKRLTYKLSESEGIIKDYCNELKTCTEYKRSLIKRVFVLRGSIYVIYHTGDISVYPDSDDIRKFYNI